MYKKEIVNIICKNHTYEYVLLNKEFKFLNCSNGLETYVGKCEEIDVLLDIFELMPELVGTETDLLDVLHGKQEHFTIPHVWKDDTTCVNIHVSLGTKVENSLLILLEDVSDVMIQHRLLAQSTNENALLLAEIENKNRQLKSFNEEMQKLVEKEVSKNIEKQHMLELQTRHAQMGEMISLITHQWKQPLSVIQTLGTLLKMKYELGTLSSELAVEKIENILQQADHMSQTVNDFQKFFTPSKKRAVFNVKKTIRTALELVKMDYAISNIELSIEGDEEAMVKGYANEYNQVILSLLQNAKDAFAKQEKANKYVQIEVRQEQEYSLVSMRDNAGGICQKNIDEIFTPYTTSKKNGSGLGLYIAKSVIENNMQGKIWVENRHDGAVFFIRI